MKYIVFKQGFVMFPDSIPEESAKSLGKVISGGEIEIYDANSKVVCYGGLPELGVLARRSDAELIRKALGWVEEEK